jgi:hypothetical protein
VSPPLATATTPPSGGGRRPAVVRGRPIADAAVERALALVEAGSFAAPAQPSSGIGLDYLPIDLWSDLGGEVTFADLVPGLLPAGPRVRSANLWIGSAGERTPVHFDRSHGVLVQLRGTKRLWLQGPRTRPRPPLDPVWKGPLANFSSYPRFLEDISGSAEVTLRSGDAVYIPPFWWHQALCETDAVSANIWWAAALPDLVRMSVRRTARDVLRRLLVRRGGRHG